MRTPKKAAIATQQKCDAGIPAPPISGPSLPPELLQAVASGSARHPDAKLIGLIEEFSIRRDHCERLFDKARAHNPNSRRHQELWRELIADHPERERLERAIATTPARTMTGALDKVSLGLRMLDHKGDGALGSIFQIAISALRDAFTLLSAERASCANGSGG
jgi:hypothetical protein